MFDRRRASGCRLVYVAQDVLQENVEARKQLVAATSRKEIRQFANYQVARTQR